jgi:hypothetical protein
MGFKSISVENYIKLHLKSNPLEDKADLKKRLLESLTEFQNGHKCSCGNDIWVIGSAALGNSCFTCITGESQPNDDYEIDLAINKREVRKGSRHIDDIDPKKISGLFDDDGYEINTDLIKKPTLCITCLNDDNPNEEILCNLTRYDQKDNKDFICFAYKKRTHG